MSRACSLAVLCSLLPVARPVPAQVARDSSTNWLTSAGSEGERYLLAMQLAGQAPPTLWSIRPFSNRQARTMTPRGGGDPWAARFAVRATGPLSLVAIQPEIGGIVNTTFPFGFNDGPIWAGRGVTMQAMAGAQGSVGPLEFSFAPRLFRAQNASFAIVPNRLGEPNVFADPESPTTIDLPQRFGDGAYQRLDPGQSWVQLGALGLAVGASTANEAWGPAVDGPFLLGTNAAGFAHLFAGTDGPLSLGPLTVSVRLIAGRLEQSAYSPVTGNARRYLTGLVGAMSLRQIPGLEIGAGRLFENVWPDSGVGVWDILSPFVHNPLKQRRAQAIGNGGEEPDNQLASVFARWIFPASGVAVYGEVGREDNSYDLRDLLMEPDHSLTFMVGMQHAWTRREGELLLLRAELLNSSVSHLVRVRNEAPVYIHTPVRQGHTQLGQVLGAPDGYAGGGTTVALDWFTRAGRRTLTWRRMLREPGDSTTTPRDVMHAVSADWLLFRSRIDLMPEATVVYNLNRNQRGDAVNLRGALTGTVHW